MSNAMTRGKPLTAPISTSGTGYYAIAISFPKNRLAMLYHLTEACRSGSFKRSRSQVIGDCIEVVIGETNIGHLEQDILDRYIDQELITPKPFKTFSDALEYELRNRSVKEIIRIWRISNTEMARLLFKYATNLYEGQESEPY